jgi:hypothetical protein
LTLKETPISYFTLLEIQDQIFLTNSAVAKFILQWRTSALHL